jgi:hypothetical protein
MEGGAAHDKMSSSGYTMCQFGLPSTTTFMSDEATDRIDHPILLRDSVKLNSIFPCDR